MILSIHFKDLYELCVQIDPEILSSTLNEELYIPFSYIVF